MSGTDTKARNAAAQAASVNSSPDEGATIQNPDEGVKSAEATNEQVQAQVDEETEQGFRGQKADPTPNEHYTVDGVTSGRPTPETDPKAARDAYFHRSALGGLAADADKE